MAQRHTSISCVPLFNASPVPHVLNQCQLYGCTLSLYARRGAGPCHKSQSSCGGTLTSFPVPMDLRTLLYQAFAKYRRPIIPSRIFAITSIVCGEERCCVPICTSFWYFCTACSSSTPSAGLWLHG